MSDIYTEFQGIADDLITEFKQGVVDLVKPGEQTGPDHNPTFGEPTTFANVPATVTGVPEELIDGSLIAAGDLIVTISGNLDEQPASGWTVRIDGKAFGIQAIRPVPPAGMPVVVKIVVRG